MAFHLLSLYWGFKTIKKGERLFVNSCPKALFDSKIEQKFWTVVTGVAGNALFIIVTPLYVSTIDSYSGVEFDPYFLITHICIGIITFVWHYLSYDQVKEWTERD